MAAAPTLHSLLDEALSLVPDLSRALLASIQEALEAKTQHFPLLDPWRRLRPRFAADFSAMLTPLLQAGRRGEDPLQRRATSLDTLSLVDEQQALQDVAIAHVIHAIDDHCKAELHQLGNVFAALRGTAKARANDNPLRPAVFARALYQSLFGVQLDAQQRYQLMQVAAQPMARALFGVYTRLCAQLRVAELTQLVASHAAKLEDANVQTRLAQARLHQQLARHPATLDGLARRVDARNSRPQPFDPTPHDTKSIFVPAVAPDMLSRLYDKILADPRLLPPLKALLARLQIAVVRLSRIDTSLLRRQDHPTWRLLNRVAAHGMVFEHANDARLQAFLNFMDAEVQRLIETPEPSALLFQQVLGRVESHISAQAQQRSESSAGALAALEREQQRSTWQPLLREQIAAQISGARMGPQLRKFLQTHWVDVILHAMVQGGREARAAQMAIDWVDALLDSLQPAENEAGRAALRRRLPLLMTGFQAGCDSINLSEEQRAPVLQELMQQHTQVLSGQAAPAQPTPVKLPEPTPEELVERLLIERESQLPEHWAHTNVDRGELPTVPVQLYTKTNSPAAAAAVQAWVQSLRLGNWYHLFIQSQWLTAQLAWISETGLFFLFVGQDADERHSLTRGALEKLLANGLIAALDDVDLVQRAVDTLMKDFDDDV
jgi:hypothetical protein